MLQMSNNFIIEIFSVVRARNQTPNFKALGKAVVLRQQSLLSMIAQIISDYIFPD